MMEQSTEKESNDAGQDSSPESGFVKRVPQLVILSLRIVGMKIAERPLDRPGDVQPHKDGLGVERREKLFPWILEEGDVPHTTFRRQSFGAPHRPAGIVPVLLTNGMEPFAVDQCVPSCGQNTLGFRCVIVCRIPI